MSTFTTNLSLQQQAVNENPGTWGTVLNTNVIQLIDNALGSTYSANVAGSSNITLSTAQAGNLIHNLTGALTGNIQYIFPISTGRLLIVNNATTGGFTVTVLTSGGTGVIVTQGSTQIVYMDSSTQIAYAPVSLTALGGLAKANNLTDVASTGSALSNLGALFSPQGRLTLVSNIPIMISESVGATSIYYAPYQGNIIPVYNGTLFINNAFMQLTLTLNTTNHPTTSVFDVYASLQSNVITLSAMYWGSNTARSTTAGGKSGTGNASIAQLNGIWVNNAAISISDSFNGTTGYAIAQYQGTYLGSFYTTSAGQTQFNIKPTPSVGGTANIIGIWNAYNRVHLDTISRDSTANWLNNSTAWNEADLSVANRISWVDGLAQTSVKASYNTTLDVGGNSQGGAVGINLNSTTATPNLIKFVQFAIASGSASPIGCEESFAPHLGFNYIQAMDSGYLGSSTAQFFGSGYQSLILQTDY